MFKSKIIEIPVTSSSSNGLSNLKGGNANTGIDYSKILSVIPFDSSEAVLETVRLFENSSLIRVECLSVHPKTSVKVKINYFE